MASGRVGIWIPGYNGLVDRDNGIVARCIGLGHRFYNGLLDRYNGLRDSYNGFKKVYPKCTSVLMKSLEAFVMFYVFWALDLVDYARWFPIHIRHENTLNGIQRIGQHCWFGRCPSRTINFNVCDGTKKQRFHQKLLWRCGPHWQFCIRGVVSRHEEISENIDFDNKILNPNNNAHRVNGPAIEITCLRLKLNIYSTMCIIGNTLDKCAELL